MPCHSMHAAEDLTAYGLSVSYAALFAACVALSCRVYRQGGYTRHQRLFIVLVALLSAIRALAFVLEPSLYPCEQFWTPEDESQPSFGVLATLPRLLFFCSYSVLVYTYQVDHADFARARNMGPRRLALALVLCNLPGIVLQVAYYGALFTGEADTRETVYGWYIYAFAFESLFLSVAFVGYGVALYTWYNRRAFFGDDQVDFDVFTFIDNHARFKERKQQIALASFVCSVAFITKGCLLLGQQKWSLFNNDWRYELLSSELGEVIPALFMVMILRNPGRIGNGGGAQQANELQEVMLGDGGGGGGGS